MPLKNIQKLIDLISELRAPTTGCAWTQQQDMHTLAPMTTGESYELMDAVLEGDPEQIKSELGDLLYHVCFFAEIARENKLFDINDVANVMLEKHKKRMPAGHEHLTAEQINAHWQSQKTTESTSLTANIPNALPPTERALMLQKRAAKFGFDWPSINGVLEKLLEEIEEFEQEITDNTNSERMQDELGDILFSAINLIRYSGAHPDAVLSRTNQKFTKRITYIEEQLAIQGKNMQDSTLRELESLWQASKRNNHAI